MFRPRALFVFVLLVCWPTVGAAKQPNILFILTDQQRYDSLACYGNDWLQAPTLNALAEESFVFDAAYVTQPVIAVARQ